MYKRKRNVSQSSSNCWEYLTNTRVALEPQTAIQRKGRNWILGNTGKHYSVTQEWISFMPSERKN